MGQIEVWGLHCDPAIKWLVSGDPGVDRYVQSFIRDQAPGDTVDVAGPPTVADVLRFRADPRGKIELPLVTLTLRKGRFGVERARCVQITCSEAGLSMIREWQRAALFRRDEALKIADDHVRRAGGG